MHRSVALLLTLVACGDDTAAIPDGGADATIDAAPITVTTEVVADGGPVHGTVDGDLVRFAGIPYAVATRFAPPTAPAPWTTPRDASAFGPGCPQNNASMPQSEDCLSINVWAHAGTGSRPVIVWVHGGGYLEGSSRDPLYDGATLARTGEAIVVSFNYRLGVLGFLALPSLVAPDSGNGNWGLRDQIAALAWVKRYAPLHPRVPSAYRRYRKDPESA